MGRAIARYEMSDDLPDGFRVLPLERQGELVVLVRRGVPVEDVVEDLNKMLGHLTGSGLWEQNWEGRREGSRVQLRAV